jgi:diguanylate cyclase (GGDEF)-like protein/PAS domain S-box-containing protein
VFEARVAQAGSSTRSRTESARQSIKQGANMSIQKEGDGSIAAAIALLQSEAWLRRMIDAVPAMITYLDRDERYLFCNRPYLEMLAKPGGDVLGRTLSEVLGGELLATVRPHLEQVHAGSAAHYERQHRGSDGSLRDLAVTFLPHLNDDGRVAGFFSLTLDITPLKSLERRLAHMAQHDPLTGLPNRALYDDRLSQAVERNRRHHEPFALMCLDVDHFKPVNDTHGHAAGDRLLKSFAGRLRESVRAEDTVARLGGDEFAVIAQGPIAPLHAAWVAAKIVAAMRPSFDLGPVSASITTSVGVAIAQDAGATADALASAADAALYEAKAKGRDGFVVSLV